MENCTDWSQQITWYIQGVNRKKCLLEEKWRVHFHFRVETFSEEVDRIVSSEIALIHLNEDSCHSRYRHKISLRISCYES